MNNQYLKSGAAKRPAYGLVFEEAESDNDLLLQSATICIQNRNQPGKNDTRL